MYNEASLLKLYFKITAISMKFFLNEKHCGRPIEGRVSGMPKVDKCGQGAREGVKNCTFMRTSFMDGPLSCSLSLYY